MSELKPCPFCGKTAHVTSVLWSYEIPTYVTGVLEQCANEACRAAVPSPPGEPGHWNSRPIEDALRAELEAAKARVQELESIGLGALQARVACFEGMLGEILAMPEIENPCHEDNVASLVRDALDALAEERDEVLAERDRLQERLDQFEAYGVPNVKALLAERETAMDAAVRATKRAKEAEAERDRLLPLARFAAEAIDDHASESFGCDDWDWAVKAGVLVQRTEPCTDDECGCEGSGECWVFASGVRETMEELRRG